MISSIIWLILVHNGHINADYTPWGIYLPVVAMEIVVYLKSLPKIADFIDKIMDNKVEGQ